MASGGSEITHGKTELISKFTGTEYGPLSSIKGGEYVNTFRDGNYWITTPKDHFLVLYRLCGGAAPEDGQFWTAERHDADQSFRDKHSVAKRWNTLEDNTMLVVPRGVYMYEGIAAPHDKAYPGGGLQVFIPRSIVKPLFHFPKPWMARNSESDREKWEAAKTTVIEIQSKIFKKWHEKRMKRMESYAGKVALTGKYFPSLPPEVQRFLRDGNSATGSSTSIASKKKITPGTYKLHEGRIKLFDGSYQRLLLSVRIEFVKTTTRTYQSGKTIITEITHHYNRIFTYG